MVKKYFSTILLLIFLFNVGGYYLCFKLVQYNIQKELKKEIRRGLKDEELSLIVISADMKNEIVWIKQHKEFLYHGEMYDLVKTEIQDQKIYYYCINDIKEKQLIANFNKNHNSKKELEKKLKQPLNTKYFPQQFSLTNNSKTHNYTYGTISIQYKLNTLPPPSPPPKFA